MCVTLWDVAPYGMVSCHVCDIVGCGAIWHGKLSCVTLWDVAPYGMVSCHICDIVGCGAIWHGT